MRVLLLLALIGTVCCKYSVWRIVPENEDQLEYLMYGMYAIYYKLPTEVGKYADIIAGDTTRDSIANALERQGISYTVFIDDVRQEIVNEAVGMGSNPDTFGFDVYHTDSEIEAWVRKLNNSVPGVNVIRISGTSEGRDVLAVNIPSSSGKTNETVIIEANIQGLDWVATSSATYIINEILNGTNEDAEWLSENYNLIIIPVLNRDGFNYTQKTDKYNSIYRDWRKTRECEVIIHYIDCGTDANRNWGYHWGEVGGSNNIASEYYIGDQAFSLEETSELSKFITAKKENLVGYFALHSYGQQILLPYGYTDEHLDDYENEKILATSLSLILKKRHNVEYTSGTFFEESGPQSGTSVDWVKGTLGVPVVMQINLGGKDAHAFMIPPDQIVPIGELALDAVTTSMKLYKKRKEN